MYTGARTRDRTMGQQKTTTSKQGQSARRGRGELNLKPRVRRPFARAHTKGETKEKNARNALFLWCGGVLCVMGWGVVLLLLVLLCEVAGLGGGTERRPSGAKQKKTREGGVRGPKGNSCVSEAMMDIVRNGGAVCAYAYCCAKRRDQTGGVSCCKSARSSSSSEWSSSSAAAAAPRLPPPPPFRAAPSSCCSSASPRRSSKSGGTATQ